ncbi:MAG: hypothetical protein HC938_15820 [Nitrospira sp.]|nr:hypothetical protein [Nitrospira sp.]
MGAQKTFVARSSLAAAIGSLLLAGNGAAQTQTEQSLEEITVTGSRIVRQDFTANSRSRPSMRRCSSRRARSASRRC